MFQLCGKSIFLSFITLTTERNLTLNKFKAATNPQWHLKANKHHFYLVLLYINFFLNGATPASFFWFISYFSNANFTVKTVGVSGIRTRIVRIEGNHADHLTNTTAQML